MLATKEMYVQVCCTERHWPEPPSPAIITTSVRWPHTSDNSASVNSCDTLMFGPVQRRHSKHMINFHQIISADYLSQNKSKYVAYFRLWTFMRLDTWIKILLLNLARPKYPIPVFSFRYELGHKNIALRETNTANTMSRLLREVPALEAGRTVEDLEDEGVAVFLKVWNYSADVASHPRRPDSPCSRTFLIYSDTFGIRT